MVNAVHLCELTTVESFKADVSSVSPLSERRVLIIPNYHVIHSHRCSTTVS